MNARLPDDQLNANALAQRKYRENPENRRKALIRNRINYALKRGWITKTWCVMCRDPKVEAHHHNGYDLEHALDVVWLCKVHHEAEHHRKNLEGAA